MIFIDFDSGKPGCEKTLATPFQLSSEAQQAPRPAPEIGQHSEDILNEYGIEAQRIEALKTAGIIGT